MRSGRVMRGREKGDEEREVERGDGGREWKGDERRGTEGDVIDKHIYLV